MLCYVKRILVTGGAGFIGSNFIHFLFSEEAREYGEFRISVLDDLTYAGRFENIGMFVESGLVRFEKCDVRNLDAVRKCVADADIVIHMAAESHVDRSIEFPTIFAETNIIGTLNVLMAVKEFGARLILVSTDEVYGSLETDFATEEYPLKPSSPYSASKASADLMALAFHKTFSLDLVITRCSNNYGKMQFPEKLIPVIITNLAANKKVPIYGEGKNVRDWIHVLDHCSGILAAAINGKSGEIYNFGDVDVLSNIDLVRKILNLMGKGIDSIEYVEDRKGHDFRYAIDSSKAKKQLGWNPKRNIDSSLEEIIDWYLEKNSI